MLLSIKVFTDLLDARIVQKLTGVIYFQFPTFIDALSVPFRGQMVAWPSSEYVLLLLANIVVHMEEFKSLTGNIFPII